jgi:hypothetical protein
MQQYRADLARQLAEHDRQSLEQQRRRQREAERVAAEGERAAEAARREAEAQARRWQSTMRSLVEGVLQPTSVTAVDWWQTEAGTYAGQWDEYARRIRSAIQDPMSEWKHLVPQDIMGGSEMARQGWLQQQLDAFYAGQLPEMIDWEGFDRQIQDRLAKQASRENLIAEAMRRAGGMASRQDVAVALGLQLTPGEMLGGDLGESFTKAFQGANLGKSATDAFTESLEAELERWEEGGATAMGAFTDGLKKGIGPSVVRTLTDAIFPELYERLRGRP